MQRVWGLSVLVLALWASQALALTQAGAVIGRIGWGVVSDKLFGGRRRNGEFRREDRPWQKNATSRPISCSR